MTPSVPIRAIRGQNPPWHLLREVALQLAMARPPVSATLIHPALGVLAALATAALLTHLHTRKPANVG